MSEDRHLMWGRRRILTIPQAAARYGLSVNATHKALARPGAPPPVEPHPIDARTPVRYLTDLDRFMNARPGRGANLRGHR